MTSGARAIRRRLTIGRFSWPDTIGEYVADLIAHAVWFAFAVTVLVVMLGRMESSIVLTVYGVCLVVLVAASLANNVAPIGAVGHWLSRIDKAVIFPFIAATCGAFLSLGGLSPFKTGVLVLIWCGAIVGAFLKLVYAGRFRKLGLTLYLGLGWVGIAGMADIAPTLGWTGCALLLGGGLVYTLGVPVYLKDTLPFRAAIWHGMCCIAGVLHFSALLVGLPA